MPSLLRSFCRIHVLMALCLGAAAAHAQSWPARPITLVVAYPAGTTADYAARMAAQDLSKTLGQTVVVENRSGGGGVIASAAVTKASPDGYMLLMTTIGPAVLRPLIDSKLNYDPVSGFTPIALVGEAPNVLAVGPNSRFKSVQDIVTYAKQNPGKLTIGHPGSGTMGHLIALLFAAEAGIDANFISYQGSPPIITDLAGGRIDVASIAYGTSIGAAKILAVTSREPLAFMPGIPTMKDSKFPNVVGSTWSGLYGPPGLPSAIVAKLSAGINAFLARPETKRQFDKVGYHVLGGPPQRLRDQMAEDRSRWSKVIAAAKLTAP